MTIPPHAFGIISDTHNVLAREIFDIFSDVNQIVHAGDIGDEDILIELKTIAPVVAVYGNTDRPAVRRHTKERLDFHLLGFDFVVTHFPGSPLPGDKPAIRINGHTHQPHIIRMQRSFYINPGSASLPRGLPQRSVVKLVITAPGEAEAEIIYF